jgi:3-dehydroquinate synthase
MKTLKINLADRSYHIIIGRGLLSRIHEFLPVPSKRAVVVTNPKIRELYGSALLQALEKNGIESAVVEIPEGETFKTLKEAETLYDHLTATRCDRNTLMVALGGGVIGDLTGFVAATYQRGVPYLQVPTTLLSQVDSSVGGKTAVNHPRGKNLIGAFYQPKAVIADLETLKSLPAEESRAGLAEVIKYGVIADPDFFTFLEENVDNILALDTGCLEHIIETSCAIKAGVVERDEYESSYRMVLNFGHTLGHAIEALTEYSTWKHGEAVAVGMVYAARLSQMQGKCSADVVSRIEHLTTRFGLPTHLPQFAPEEFIETMSLDKKVRDGKIKFVLVRAIGSVEIVDTISTTDLEHALRQ